MKSVENNKSYGLGLGAIVKILLNYKLFILFSMIVSIILAGIYLYFTPVTYSSSGSMEVITYDKSNSATDDLLENTFFYSMSKEIDKEIEKLKTYKTNKKVIDSMNLGIQIFTEGDYGKKIEMFEDEYPINIIGVSDIKDEIYGRMIKVIPKENGFYLKMEHSIKEKLFKTIFKKKLMSFDNENELYPYNEPIETKYFKLTIEKLKDFTTPIYFSLHGNSHYIYENFVMNKLTVEQPNKNAPIIRIAYEDNIPKRSTLYVNRLISTFIEEGRLNKTKRNEKISEFIRQGLKENSKELKRAEMELEKYKVKNKVIKTSVQADLVIKKLSDIEVKISENDFKEMVINSILDELDRNGNFNTILSLLKRLDAKVLIDYIVSLQKLELEENKLSSEYTDEYPELITLREEISNIKENIYSGISSLKSSIAFEKENLRKLKRDAEREFRHLPNNETNVINLDRKYKILLGMNDYLLKKKKENDMVKAAIISDYSIVEEAYPPKYPIKPKRSLVQVLSLLFGFMVGALLALLHNALSNKIIDKNDIERHTDLEISGIIPLTKKRYIDKNIEVFRNPQSKFADSFRKLRTDLQFATKSNESNIFLVTSMFPKEGKSSVAVNLSAIFQLAGFKTIIIDLDLRKPSIHKYFDIAYDSGMSEYLSGKVDISDIIFPTIYPNLDIIPAGSIPINPSELILSSRIKTLLNKLREEYKYIIIDSTPISISTDTLNLMDYADINLVVIRKEYSKKSSLHKLEEIIKKYHLKNIKLIVNATKESEKY